LSGAEWEYAGSMVIDAHSASATTVSVVNQGSGQASLDVEKDITLGGTVDGVDLSSFKSSYDSHVADANAHHTRSHSITSSSDHTATGAALDIVGLSATNTLGILTPSASPGAAAAILKTDSSGILTLVQLTASTKVRTPAIDTASGNLAIAPAGGTVAITGGVTATTSVSVPTVTTASGNLTLTSTGGTVAVTGALTVSSTATVTTSVTTPLVTSSASLALNAATGTAVNLNVNGMTYASVNASRFDIDTTLRVRQNGATRYRSDRYVSGGYTYIDAYDDTGLTYMPLYLDSSATIMRAYASASNYMQFDASGLKFGSGHVTSDDYASRVTGWRMTYAGALDARNIYADEMHVKAFVADLEQALAGGQIISKSVAVIATDFVAPYAGGSQILTVEDLPSASNMAVFEANDIVALRSFSRASGTLTVGYCYGAVTGYTDGSGTQSWTFTRSGTTTYNTITQRGSATSASTSSGTSVAPTKPTGVTSGDVLLAVVTHDGSADTITATGWTMIGAYQSGSDINLVMYYKVAGGAEGSSYTFSTGSSHALAASVVAYYNVSTASAFDDYSYSVNSAGTQLIGATVYATATANQLVFLGGITNNTSSTPPSGMTELIDAGSSGIRVYVAHQALAASGETGSKVGTISASHASIVGMVTLRPTYSSMSATAGAIAAGTTIEAKGLALDFGISGNGYYEVTTVDGTYGANSPYAQVVSWTTHPQSGSVVRNRIGHLNGLFSVANEYGFYAGDGTGTANNYLRLSSYTAAFNNIPITMYNSGTKIVELSTTTGLDIAIDTDADDGERAISFQSGGTTYSHIKGYTVGDIHYVLVQANHISGLDSGVQIRASAITGKDGVISLSTFGELTTLSNYITMTHPASADVNDATIEIYSTGDISLTADSLSIASSATISYGLTISAGNINMNGNNISNVAALGIGYATPGGAWTTSGWSKAVEFANQGAALVWRKAASGVARGIGVSSNGVLYFARSTASDNSAAVTYDMYLDTNGGLVMQPAAGTSAIYIATPANQTVSGIYLAAADMGSSYGPHIVVSRNSNASTPASGFMQIVNRGNSAYSIWPDNSGNLRIGTATPTNANDTSGTVVGTQTSSLDSKNILGPVRSADYAIEQVVLAARRALRQFQYKSGAFDYQIFEGIITDYAPRYGMDRDAAHPAGKSLNEIQLFSDLLLSVEWLYDRVLQLEAQCARS